MLGLIMKKSKDYVMNSNKFRIDRFRSGGFVNKDPDMGRVYIDLPIIDAKKFTTRLNNNKDIKEYIENIYLYN